MYIDVIKPSQKDLFKCSYLLFIPDSKISSPHLVVEMGNPKVENSVSESVNNVVNEFVCGTPFYDCYKKALINSNSIMIMPIFPRYLKNGNETCIVEFNSASFETKNPLLRRMDLQTIAMIEDAKQRLKQNGLIVENKIILTGYSASAQFALRFSVIYPELVSSVIAGGFNGLGTLPLETYGLDRVYFPLGVYDIEEKFGRKFDQLHFSKIDHHLYMGDEDRHEYHKISTIGGKSLNFVDKNFSGDIIDNRLKKYLDVMKKFASVEFRALKNCDHFISKKIANEKLFAKSFEDYLTNTLSKCQNKSEIERDYV